MVTTTTYDATITSVSTITEEAATPTTSVHDSAPTFIIGNYNTGSQARYDNDLVSLQLPFAIGAFGAYSTQIQVSVNGFITLGGSIYSIYDYENYGLPSAYLPDVTICGLWDNLFIYGTAQQGISYRINGLAPNRIIIFEYRISTYNLGHEQYHFSMTFAEAQPGVVLFKYFEMYESGYTATSGAQRLATGKSLQFSYDERKLSSFSYVRLDTEAGTMTSGTLASLEN